MTSSIRRALAARSCSAVTAPSLGGYRPGHRGHVPHGETDVLTRPGRAAGAPRPERHESPVSWRTSVTLVSSVPHHTMWMSHSCSWHAIAGTFTPYPRAGPGGAGLDRDVHLTSMVRAVQQ